MKKRPELECPFLSLYQQLDTTSEQTDVGPQTKKLDDLWGISLFSFDPPGGSGIHVGRTTLDFRLCSLGNLISEISPDNDGAKSRLISKQYLFKMKK